MVAELAGKVVIKPVLVAATFDRRTMRCRSAAL